VNASRIVEAVREIGGNLWPEGDRIHYRLPKEALPLLVEIQQHKSKVLSHLQNPPRIAVFNYLRPYQNKMVWTPVGPGRLTEIHINYVVIQYVGSRRMRWYDSSAVLPMI